MSKEERLYLGKQAELAVADYFKSISREVIYADWFDQDKDLVIDGLNYEVKTQVPWYTEDSFSLRFQHPNGSPATQWTKCIRADYTVFISIPLARYPFHSDNKIFLIKGSDLPLNFKKKRTADRRLMHLIPIRQETMVYVTDIQPETSKIIEDNNQSMWY